MAILLWKNFSSSVYPGHLLSGEQSFGFSLKSTQWICFFFILVTLCALVVDFLATTIRYVGIWFFFTNFTQNPDRSCLNHRSVRLQSLLGITKQRTYSVSLLFKEKYTSHHSFLFVFNENMFLF
jgi:hypothetical protein